MIARQKTVFRDYIRLQIGDKAKKLFGDDELDGFIERFCSHGKTERTVRAHDGKYKIFDDCSCISYPVKDIELISGYDDNGVYIIDEHAAVIYFDEDDPENTGTAPDDGDTMVVAYDEVNVPLILSEIFLTLSSNHAKLTSLVSTAGGSFDMKQLSEMFFKTSLRWAYEAEERNCSYDCS